MSSSFGKNLKITLFGQSHSHGLGVVIDGLPAGEEIDLSEIGAWLKRRQGGQKSYTTARAESDELQILSGLVENRTCAAPLCAVFTNQNVRSEDYATFVREPRPSHVDYVALTKYGGSADLRGGGHFSGRLTLPICFAGAICAQILQRRGITVGAHIASIGEIKDQPYDPVRLTEEELKAAREKEFPVNDHNAGSLMVDGISQAQKQGDSLGGIVECAALGLPVGVGEPFFDGLESRLSAALFAIPAVKGVEFGSGFTATKMRGSEHNDAFYYLGEKIQTYTNHAGGIIGGLSTGMPLVVRVAFKPTASIALEQDTVNLATRQNTKLKITGRHDPCIAVRAVPCVEAVTSLVLLDLLLQK